jgi:hypothetical protein
MRSTTLRLALVAAMLCMAAACGSDDDVELCPGCTTPTPTPTLSPSPSASVTPSTSASTSTSPSPAG